MSAEFPLWARTTFDEPEEGEGDEGWAEYFDWLFYGDDAVDFDIDEDPYPDGYDQAEYIREHSED